MNRLYEPKEESQAGETVPAMHALITGRISGSREQIFVAGTCSCSGEHVYAQLLSGWCLSLDACMT